jgi:cell division protein FtsA
MNEQEILFSMDIGTRSVVGIVGRHDGEKLNILAYEIEEHKERAMYDGQVHDIELVAKAAGNVKRRLEEKLGIKLKNVAIAAAGRSLKTHKVLLDRKIEKEIEVERDTISSLEIEAIQKAQVEVEKMHQGDGNHYYCVGYAVVNYYLNGGIIGNLEGHKASSIGVEVLATFLPKIVVDSLYSVVSRIDLEVSSLTLEPIAAINVSVQSNLRMLNIALVDVGAGTSDIALTKNGSVFAFAMVPVAGDEITEKLAETYLLDFETAEKIKTTLSRKSKIKFKDIMGNSKLLLVDEMIAAINPTVEQLAKDICDKILEYNGKSPSAVFLVGGGSLVPGLEEHIAMMLQLPTERVGLRKITQTKDLDIKDKKLSGAEFVTPIGIAVTAFMNKQKDFLTVYVNEKCIKLFNSKTLTVADSLILVGFNPRKLIGRRGLSLTFTINGKIEIVKGELGEAAKIFINGMEGSLDKTLSNGDRIIIDPAVDGNNAEAYIASYTSLAKGKIVYVNNIEKILSPVITVNNERQPVSYKIKEQDSIEITTINTVQELFEYMQIDTENIYIDINGNTAELNSSISNGDYINWNYNIKTEVQITSKILSKSIVVTVNGEQFSIEQNKDKLMFLDIFNHIEVDILKIKGINSMKLNGKDANYTDIIRNNDIIEFHWEK